MTTEFVKLGYVKTVASYKAEELLLPRESERRDQSQIDAYPIESKSEQALLVEKNVNLVKKWLISKDRSIVENMQPAQQSKFKNLCKKFFVSKKEKFYRRGKDMKHKLVVERNDRMYMLKASHDSLGHRGVYATQALIEERFWWPGLAEDVAWYVKTCQKCQERLKILVKKPPQETHTPSLFETCHADTLYMPTVSHGRNRILHARDSLSSWLEIRAIKVEDTKAVAMFLLEDIITRWGMIRNIVTDNAPLWTKAVEYLSTKYGIVGIQISAYNSQANGKIE